jgi:acetyl-CoA acetyltransferase
MGLLANTGAEADGWQEDEQQEVWVDALQAAASAASSSSSRQ